VERERQQRIATGMGERESEQRIARGTVRERGREKERRREGS
jgi:hypothetical protein